MSGIARPILDAFPQLNGSQKRAIAHTTGPAQVIAGPGSGKTLVLVLRTLNLLLGGRAEPRHIMLCTFTEKAAYELRDRLSAAARSVGWKGDVSSIQLGTIHSIANGYLREFRHYTATGSVGDVLDDLTQHLFIYEHREEIIGEPVNGKYFGRWSSRWHTIKALAAHFNKITEEIVDPQALAAADDDFTSRLGVAYMRYTDALLASNRLDFAHQQRFFFDLLKHPIAGPEIRHRTRFVMVDEYQDTNFIQEQIFVSLVGKDGNVLAVGDEDQALYRFRGATVRNILQFDKAFPNAVKLPALLTNYRSHPDIIAAYGRYMDAGEWIDQESGEHFRFEKTVQANPDEAFPHYPAVFAIWGETRKDEARRFADMVSFLLKEGIIEDASQVALLLHSVKEAHSSEYIRALEANGLSAFCPRARTYFTNEEVQLMVACFAVTFGYYGEARGKIRGRTGVELVKYVDECINLMARKYADPHPLAKLVQQFASEIESLSGDTSLDRRLADYFYQFLACEPFPALTRDENQARNLAIFSQLLAVFQTYYHQTVLTARNREIIRNQFFGSFLRLLYDGGINEYEDPDSPFPKGYVQIMTIHQAKGLEFPVVVVGSLSNNINSAKDVDRTLSPYYQREPFEPDDRITHFDRMRLHYVAFSRAEKILVLTSTEDPKPHFSPIWQGLPQWPYVEKDLLKSLAFKLRHRMPVKRTFSFTGDVKVFETCPRQYQFFREYEFTPARTAEVLFGAVVHETIEDIHRNALDGTILEETGVKDRFEANYAALLNRGLRPIGPKQKETALQQVLTYLRENKHTFKSIIDTEVDVSVEKDQYILTGRIDLLMSPDNELTLLDFKSQPRPRADEARIDGYYKQLCIYGHILEQRYGKKPDRLLVYWTGEPTRERALMEFPYNPDDVDAAGAHFDQVVSQILAEEYSVQRVPEAHVCAECDLRAFCESEGIIRVRKGEHVER
ncbi:MAG TPA: ATP-dependent helicase [Candidatus Acetothermia bacterium]|nr:ATP-dependent helicase [Candidatus Acetothermia bacterium]